MKKLRTALPLLLLSLNATASLEARELTRAWECDTFMDKPESALYAESTGLIYVSNISGEYFALDGGGFISTLNLDGTVQEAKWFCGGLNNPQGLALSGEKLFVADLTRIARIDLKSGELDKFIPIEDSKFINDLSADENGDIYATDCSLNRIYRIRGDAVELWLESPELNSPNGILCLKDTLLVINFQNGKLYSVNKADKSFTLVCDGIANGDGICSDGEGGFFVSGAWQGEVFHIDAQGTKTLVLNLGPEEKIVADISYIPSEKLLLIPTLYKTVLGYRWE